MADVLQVKAQCQIPELNAFQCGTRMMDSLSEAQEIEYHVITRWATVQ